VQNSLYVQVLRSPILAALLHGTPAAGVSQTLRRGTRNGITELSQTAPPTFGWAAITMDIGPHSSFLFIDGGHVAISVFGVFGALSTTAGRSYSNILFVSELTSLESRRDQLSRSFFQDITHLSSSLYHLLPSPRDTSVLSRLRSHTVCTSCLTHQKYCSFINYALNRYRVPPRNS